MIDFKFKDLFGDKLWMLSEIDEDRYSELKEDYQHLSMDFYDLYGYALNQEIVEAAIVEADKCEDPMVLSHLPGLKENVKEYLRENLFNGHYFPDHAFTCFLCTGLVAVPTENFVESDDDSEYFLIAFDNPMDTAPVYLVYHDSEPEQLTMFRCSVSEWVLIPQGDYNGLDIEGADLMYIKEAQNKWIEKMWQQYHTKMEELPFYKNPEYLYKRVFWLNQLSSKVYYPKKKGYVFSEAIKRYSYDLSEYQKDKQFFKDFTVLANYWLLAHFLFDNINACRETISLAKQCPGKVTPALAELVEEALEKRAGLGILRSELLNSVKDAIKKRHSAFDL